MSFSAVFRERSTEASEHAILELERNTPSAVKRVLETWREHDYAYEPEWYRVGWVDTYDVLEDVPRPVLPSTKVSLRLEECFYLTFGEGATWAYHSLWWWIFLQEPGWQPVMLDACAAFARHLGSDEFIVTRDESPLVLAFLDGAGYREAIERAIAAGEPEVHDLMDMYIEIDDSGTWDSRGFFRVRLDAT